MLRGLGRQGKGPTLRDPGRLGCLSGSQVQAASSPHPTGEGLQADCGWERRGVLAGAGAQSWVGAPCVLSSP